MMGLIAAIHQALHTLLGRLTAERAGYLDAPISALPTSAVRSVQRGTVTMSSGSEMVAIAAVDMSRSVLVFSANYGHSSSVSDLRQPLVRGRLHAPTELRFSRGGTLGELTVDWQVVEYE